MLGRRLYSQNAGFTLIEAMVSVLLVGTLVVGILGAFIIARLSTDRAKHRMMAMNTIRAYMEQEIRAGYLGGYGMRPSPPGGDDTDYYVTVDSDDPVEFTIDNLGTDSDDGDNLIGTITPDPFPAETYEIGAASNTCRYKKVGFVIEWREKQFGDVMPISSERAAVYVAEHS